MQSNSLSGGGVGDNYTRGPWEPAMLERPQLLPHYVVRQIGPSHWEQLRDQDGALARFETAGEARAALTSNAAAAANGEME